MKSLSWFVIVLIALTYTSQAQNKNFIYRLPAGIKQQEYQPGKVWVKLKKEFVPTAGPNQSAKQNLLPGTMRPVYTRKGSSTSRAQAFKPAIDLSLYYQVSFDPSIAVETFVNQLYATGKIEFAEPVFREQMQLTPNDPSFSSQYFLTKIKATEAWDITLGSEEIVIGIIDSGVDIDHPDLVDKIFINQTEANGTAGVDDDGNGFVDDVRGWDFSGADTLNVFDPDFVGDNDPAIYKSGAGFGHGTQVGGCAAASTNNGIGVAGVAYNSKLLFTKHFADNQKSTDRSYSSDLYQGIIYAAENGAKIINCSWGGTYRSQFSQDVITYVTLDLGCLVVAAAGNSGNQIPLYPAAYDYVLSVGATDQADKKSGFSNYGTTVDLVAPGSSIRTTSYNNTYTSPSGTSFSSPITAGAAALVWSVYPDFSPLQVAEQLRVTADASIYTINPDYLNKLGKGRLDILKAITTNLPSIRALNYKLVNSEGSAAEPGDEALLYFDFKNYLSASSGALSISISTTSSDITITDGTISPGAINSGATIRNTLTPFKLTLSNSIGENAEIILTITFNDGEYQDSQSFTFVPNPSYRDIDDNKVLTTLSGSGRVGYDDTENSAKGVGFLFNDKSILYEMGIIMGNSGANILNSVRNESGFDQDFVSIEPIRELTPGERSYSELYGKFSNSKTEASQQVQVAYRSLVWRETPYDKFVILEYKVKNTQVTTMSNFYFGMFADWDISYHGGNDAARWNNETKLGYVYPKQSTELPHAGVQLLLGNSNYFAIDNDHTISGNPLGLYDGYTDAEKFTTISNGLSKDEAGNSTTEGNDVSHVVSAGPYTIGAGEEITIAFALHAANNFDDLVLSAKYADSIYNYTLNATQPVVAEVETCYGGSAQLTATGAAKYKWYKEFTGGEPLAATNQFIVNNVHNDTVVYVSNATNTYESIRTAAIVKVKASPEVIASRSTTLCEGETVTLSVDAATGYLWNTGETTQTISVAESGDYSVIVTYGGVSLNCESASVQTRVEVLPRTITPEIIVQGGGDAIFCSGDGVTLVAAEGISYMWNTGATSQSIDVQQEGTYHATITYQTGEHVCAIKTNEVNTEILALPNATFNYTLTDDLNYDFFNAEADASSWLWNFGDGNSSNEQNPSHHYADFNDYTVSLTVNHENGCSNTFTQTISVVLGDEDKLSKAISIYPTPTRNKTFYIKVEGIQVTDLSVELLDAYGASQGSYQLGDMSGTLTKTIQATTLNAGMYFVKIMGDTIIVVKKIVIE